MDPGEAVGVAALGVLTAVFLGSLVALAVICYRKHFLATAPHRILGGPYSKGEGVLIEECGAPPDGAPGLELEDVTLAPQIHKILSDAQWLDDATGLIPHCLAILKLCHSLTERLMASTLAPLPPHQITLIIQASRRVSPRLDDVARAMYPPLDPCLLEARCSALTLTLALLAARTHPLPPSGQPSLLQRDIADALIDMDRHVKVLRDAAQCYETFHEMLTEGVTSDSVEC